MLLVEQTGIFQQKIRTESIINLDVNGVDVPHLKFRKIKKCIHSYKEFIIYQTSSLNTRIMNTGQSMSLDIYINYPGVCEKAFRFYEQHLDAKIKMMAAHHQPPPNFPKEWENPILHAIIELGGTLVRGADIPDAEPMRSVYLTLRFDTSEKAEHVYDLLTSDGKILMKMEKTAFANRFAMLRDKFGTLWMLLNEN